MTPRRARRVPPAWRALPAVLVALGIALTAFLGFAPGATAGTTGRLTGRVVDGRGEPLIGANVQIVGGPRLGAVTDADGRYSIVNIPAGRWDVRFQFLGYRTVNVQGVEISADQSHVQNATLTESAVELEEVVVTSRRPVVEVGKTSAISTVTREEIASLPVQELSDIVDLQAGVVDGHFRGGRIGEVQYQVDGVTVNNPFNNESGIRIDRSLLEEVQVISGTFDAEYGQAASGVVNAVLRRGTDTFQWHGEVFGGAFLFPGRGDERLVDDSIDPARVQNYQFDASGPLPGIGSTVYLVSGRRSVFDDYLDATRIYVPTDRYDGVADTVIAHGDGDEVPLGFSREWNGIVKLTNRSIRDVELSYQVLANRLKARPVRWDWRFNPEGVTDQTTRSIVHGLDLTHTLGKATFYQFAARQNYVDYTDWKYPDLYDARYDSAGGRETIPGAGEAFAVGGVDLTRFRQRTNAVVLKGSIVSQAHASHFLKAGAEWQWSWLRFGSPGHLRETGGAGGQQLTRFEDQPPTFPPIGRYHPLSAAAYAQDEIDWNDLKVRAGLRFDWFDARWGIPSDLRNPANAIAGAPPSTGVPTTAKTSLSPRLGVSYPLSDRAAVFFAYGHFSQMPPLGTVFTNADYGVLATLQAGQNAGFGTFGNPDIGPERTVQYQFGYKHALRSDLGLDVQLFYKDIRDLLGVEFIETYNNAQYARLTNVDYGGVLGFTVALDQRPIGLFSYALDYTWQRAQGNSSDPYETATRAETGQDPRPRQIPFDWDQRHTLNLSLRLARPGNFEVSSIVRVGSGQPYTPPTVSNLAGETEENAARKPAGVLVDVRGEKALPVQGIDLKLFARVFNLFDTRYFNGFVFNTTGSPFYSRNPDVTQAQLNDPTRFHPPRRIELGVTLAGPAR